MSPLSTKNAGQTGLNRTTHAVSSTSTWYAFAGQVTRMRAAASGQLAYWSQGRVGAIAGYRRAWRADLDHGRQWDQFASKAMDAWAYQYGVQLNFIRPGRPVENCYIESFNGRLRDECLNVEVFFALIDVRDKLERWRQDYNQVRPHSALRDSAPAVFAAQWTETATAGPEAVPVRAGKPAEGNLLERLT